MTDESRFQDKFRRPPPSAGLAAFLGPKDSETEGVEGSGPYGYLRGLKESSMMVEFRFRDGYARYFAYGLLGQWHFNPSEGLLLKFSGDVVSLVLIRGSCLDKPIKDGANNLIYCLQRGRLLWVREMSRDEIEKVGETGPTIDSIQIEEFETRAAMREWLKTHAPAFLRSEQ